MSTRDYKEFAPGEYYHVFNRGNNKIEIFSDASDYALFNSRLAENLYPSDVKGDFKGALPQRDQRKRLPADSFMLLAYCLMPNHFHLLFRQESEIPISMLMLKVIGSYSKCFNKKYARVGSLFQDQFKAVHIESESQLLHISAYIHQNARVAGIVADAALYPFSSYREYLSITEEGNLSRPSHLLERFKDRGAYRAFVEESLETIERNKDIELEM